MNLNYAAQANYLITGNSNDFAIQEFENTKIVSPKKFRDLYKENNL